MTAALVLLLLSADAKEQQRVSNLIPFDVATCTPPKLTPPPNAEGVTGALRLLRPHVIECLVARTTDPTVTLSADGALTVTGVEGAAKECIEKAAAGITFPKGVKATTEVRVGGLAVKTGVNTASDIAAAIRLAQAQWCDCYGEGHPGLIKVDVKVKPGGMPEPANGPGCLASRLRTLKVVVPGETMLPYTFLLLDSGAARETPDAPAELQFQQLDAIRARRSAEGALAVGARIEALTTYDDGVKKYNAAKKPFKMVKELVAKCANLVKADDALVMNVMIEAVLESHTAELAEGFAAKDPQWKSAADAARAQATAAEAEVKKVRAAHDSDAKTCPK